MLDNNSLLLSHFLCCILVINVAMLLTFLYKFKSNKLLHYLQQLCFKDNTSTHSHTTRIQYNNHQFKPNHEYVKTRIYPDLPRFKSHS